MSSWRISYAIKNLEPEIKSKNEIEIDNVLFHRREKVVVGTVLTDDDEENAILEARQKIDRAVSKLCYIYHKEVSMITDGIYLVDLADPSVETVIGEFVLMHDIGMDTVEESALSKLNNLDPNKQELAHKTLGLFRVAQASSDPFKAIDSYFSCIHAVLKDQSNPISPASDLKKGLKLILQKRKGISLMPKTASLTCNEGDTTFTSMCFCVLKWCNDIYHHYSNKSYYCDYSQCRGREFH